MLHSMPIRRSPGLAADLGRALRLDEIGHLAQRNDFAAGRAKRQVVPMASTELRRLFGIAELDVEGLLALVDLGDGFAADGGLDERLDVLDREPVAGDPARSGRMER